MKNYDCKTSTPWGRADSARQYAPGIISYSTPSHGGFHLSEKRLLEMPAPLRNEHNRRNYAGRGWFEEDCEWCLVVLAFPQVFTEEKERDTAENTFRNWYPEAWEHFHGRQLKPGESNTRDEAVFYADNKDNWLTIAAWGDWQGGVPEGFIGVCAIQGGRQSTGTKLPEKYFLVPEAEYDGRKFSFVIDPARHQIVDNFTNLPHKTTP